MTNDDLERLREQLRQQYSGAADAMLRSAHAWNELLAASTDMAFDLVLKNWDYSRSVRGATDQAIADTIKMQQRLSREMIQAWQGYSSDLKDILDRNGK